MLNIIGLSMILMALTCGVTLAICGGRTRAHRASVPRMPSTYSPSSNEKAARAARLALIHLDRRRSANRAANSTALYHVASYLAALVAGVVHRRMP